MQVFRFVLKFYPWKKNVIDSFLQPSTQEINVVLLCLSGMTKEHIDHFGT